MIFYDSFRFIIKIFVIEVDISSSVTVVDADGDMVGARHRGGQWRHKPVMGNSGKGSRKLRVAEC